MGDPAETEVEVSTSLKVYRKSSGLPMSDPRAWEDLGEVNKHLKKVPSSDLQELKEKLDGCR